jgi:hypothetical protein
MTKRLFEIECLGRPVTVEITGRGPVFHGYDPDVEEAARALGVEGKSFCAIVQNADKEELTTYLIAIFTAQLAGVEVGTTDLIEILLALGADANKRGLRHLSSLSVAVRNERLDLAKMMLEYGAYPSQDAMNQAIFNCDLEAAEMLVEHGVFDDWPGLPSEFLMQACQFGCPNLVQFFINHLDEVSRANVQDADYLTAVFSGPDQVNAAEVIRLLLEQIDFPKGEVVKAYESTYFQGDSRVTRVFEEYICAKLDDEDE